MEKIQPEKFARKPFYVDVVRVTAENIEAVAEWAMGDVRISAENGEPYIKVRVQRPLNERQTQAFVGDYVLYASTGFKVYNADAFAKSFEKVHILTPEQAAKAGIRPPIEPKSG